MAQKTKTIASTRKLRSTKTMEFVKREFVVPMWNNEWRDDLREMHDYYLHKETGITLVRETHCRMRDGQGMSHLNWVMWTCPELGGGNASLSYWIMLAKSNPRRRHDQ